MQRLQHTSESTKSIILFTEVVTERLEANKNYVLIEQYEKWHGGQLNTYETRYKLAPIEDGVVNWDAQIDVSVDWWAVDAYKSKSITVGLLKSKVVSHEEHHICLND